MQIDFNIPVRCPFCGTWVYDKFAVRTREDTTKMLQCRCGKSFYVRREISAKVKLYPVNYFETNGRSGAGYRMDQQKGYEDDCKKRAK